MKNKFIQDKLVFYAGLVYFIAIVLYIALRIIWNAGAFFELDPIFNDLLFSVFVQIFALAGIPFLLWKILTKQTFKQTTERFFFKKVSFVSVLVSLGLGILMYIVIVYVSSFWQTLLSFFGYSASGAGVTTQLPVWAAFLLTLVSTVFLPGFCEETAHRGLMLGNMRNNGLKRGILLTALLFGLAHLNIVQFGYAFVVGLVLAAVVYITRSIWPAMIIHATSNFCSVYLDYASAYDWFGGGLMNSISNFLINSNVFVSLLVSFLVICIVLVLVAMCLSKLYVENKRAKFKQFKRNLYNSVKGTEMEREINFNNELELLTLFNKALANDLKDKVDSGRLPLRHLERELGNSPLNTMIYSELDEYRKPRAADNIFLYMAIVMMSIVTIATFIWGL